LAASLRAAIKIAYACSCLVLGHTVRANGPHPGAVVVLSGWCLPALWFGGEQATLLLRVDADLRAPD
jgi:hypothetical protein